jgi:hypothetical protein
LAQLTLEQVIAGIQSLPPSEQQQLRRWLAEQAASSPSPVETRQVAPIAPSKAITLEAVWLDAHRDEYAGQWVALDGDRLICASANAKEVYAAAQAAGITDALIVRVEPRGALPFAGW